MNIEKREKNVTDSGMVVQSSASAISAYRTAHKKDLEQIKDLMGQIKDLKLQSFVYYAEIRKAHRGVNRLRKSREHWKKRALLAEKLLEKPTKIQVEQGEDYEGELVKIEGCV